MLTRLHNNMEKYVALNALKHMPAHKRRLPKVFKAQWLNALESGEYEQGNGSLFSDNDEQTDPRYCCLGVACAMRGVETHTLTGNEMPLDVWHETLAPARLPELLRQSYDHNGKNLPTLLATFNDKGMSFGEIAEQIRTHC